MPKLALKNQMGADIVVTGRTADSALALAPLMHEFKWDSRDFDRLAAGSLAGHIIECGGQATGGLFTDFDKVALPLPMIKAKEGYPIIKIFLASKK